MLLAEAKGVELTVGLIKELIKTLITQSPLNLPVVNVSPRAAVQQYTFHLLN
jgi:hypothetical protein